MSSPSNSPRLCLVSPPDGALSRGRSLAPPGRRTIAVLTDYMDFCGIGYERQIREAFHARCLELGYDLLLVYGRRLEEPRRASAAHNAIFELVDRDSVDGIIVVSTSLAAYCGMEGLLGFFQRYRSLPVCSLGVAVPGVPSLLTDNYAGMEALVEHMVVEHGCRHVAFLTGPPDNPESKARFAAYRGVLERSGLSFDPALVATGYFITRGGKSAMDEILARGVPVDAVVAANDAMAFGAIEALRAHRHRVPRELPVTGFDDVPLARLGNPPLTTVGQPFRLIAQRALGAILDQLNGHEVAAVTLLPTELRIRQSCGCGSREGKKEAIAPRSSPDAAGHLQQNGPRIRQELEACLDAGCADSARCAGLLLDALEREVRGEAESLVRAVEDLLSEFGADSQRHAALQNAISCLRAEFSGTNPAALSEVWYQALSRVALAHTAVQLEHRVRIDENFMRLTLTAEQLSVAFDLPSLQTALSKSLRTAGVATAFVSRYPEGRSDQLEPFVCLLDGSPADPTFPCFPARQLLPPGAYPAERRHTSLVFPLVFEDRQLGVAVFEYVADVDGYSVLQDQVSAALVSVQLHEEVVHKTMLHERSVQERLATAKRMQSLSVLAGGVAHDLNNALGPLVALPDVMLRELDEAQQGTAAALDLRADIESIKCASMRAAQTIKDLLTLARQGTTSKEPIDLSRAIANCLAGDSLRQIKQVNVQVKVVVDLPPEALLIRASEPHLVRAITNLVRNAAEAIDGDGQVVVKGRIARLTEPLAGYETVEPGEYVAVSVSDNGSGIPAQDLGWVFEPFFSKKRLGEQSGTGLGLAIVHGVVKEHAGFLDVSSTVGQGTTFTLYFPRVRESARQAEAPAAAREGRAKILIVDDEPIQLRTGRRVLTNLGYQVDTLSSGQSACQLFEQASRSGNSPYDLVILDVILNEAQDGLEVYQRIVRAFPALRVILCSGQAPNGRAEVAISHGLVWLLKPYSRETLAQSVHQALSASGSAGEVPPVFGPGCLPEQASVHGIDCPSR